MILRILRRPSGIRISDLTGGFRAYSADVMKTLVTYEGAVLDYQCVGVLLLRKKYGFIRLLVKQLYHL